MTRQRAIALGLIGLFLLGWCLVSSRFFSSGWNPIIGSGDTQVSEHQGYYFATQLHLFPFPQLQLDTDTLLYPFGVFAGFQAWVLEREYSFAIARALFGIGPWNQIYLWLTTLLTGVLTFALLRRTYGTTAAGLSAIAVGVTDFYALYKFPFHGNLVATHWLVASIFADHLWYRRSIHHHRISLHWFLARVVLLLLSLGQDLSYVAGLSLTSFTVTLISMLVVLRRTSPLWVMPHTPTERRRVWVLSAAIVVLAWLYLPLCLQIFLKARSHPAGSGIYFWANPLRLLAPWLPIRDLSPDSVSSFFQDRSESIFDLRIGWFLVLPALAGVMEIVRGRKREFYPALILTVLLLTFHPTNFPLLKVLPWFGMNRVSGRITLALVPLAVLLTLAIPWKRWAVNTQRITLLILTVLLLVEIPTMARNLGPTDLHPLTSEQHELAQKVQELAGDAVLDWPFCIAAGNAVREELCADLPRAVSDYTFQRFHGKKVVGANLGRLTRELTSPYAMSGWPLLLTRAARNECFSDKEWGFFVDFVNYYRFSGVLLHRDSIPPSCREEFYKRFSKPKASASLVGSGTAELLTVQGKPPAQAPLLAPELPPQVDVITEVASHPELLTIEGLARTHAGCGVQGAAQLRYALEQPATVVFEGIAQTWLPELPFEIFAGKEVVHRGVLRANAPERIYLQLQRPAGVDTLTIRPLGRPDLEAQLTAVLERRGDLKDLQRWLRERNVRMLEFSQLQLSR